MANVKIVFGQYIHHHTGDTLPSSDNFLGRKAINLDTLEMKMWNGTEWTHSSRGVPVSIWKIGSPTRSVDLSEDGYENTNHVTTGITVGVNNVLGEAGQPYSAYASMILGSEITNKTSGYGIASGAKHVLDTVGGAYNTVVGFFNKIVTATASSGNFLAGKFNFVSGTSSNSNASFGGVDSVSSPSSPLRFLEISGFGNFNVSWVGETGATATRGKIGGSFNFMSGHNNEIEDGVEISAILGGRNNLIPSGLLNTVILGGTSIQAVKSNYAYVPGLNIKTVENTSAVIILGLDQNGNVTDSGLTVGPTLITWANLVTKQNTGNVHVGDAYEITDQGNEELLITGKSPDGSTWFRRIDNAGVETIFKVE